MVDSERARLGALQNRMGHAINNLYQSSENISTSNSRIRDADYAKQTIKISQNMIQQQAAQSMLSQANQTPYEALILLN